MKARIANKSLRFLAMAAWIAASTSCAVIRPVDEVIARDAGEAPGEVASADEPVPEVSDGLDAPEALPSRAELRAYTDERLVAFDERCRGLLERARAEGAGYDELMEASRELVFNADMRIQATVCFRYEPGELPDPKTLIDCEDDVSSELKSEVRSLASSSKELADRALELREGDPAGRLFSTLGAGLYLWSLGPLEALTSGGATSLPGRVSSLAEDHPGFEGASPLRLKGRFQSRAPWPYKDRKGGVDSLQVAVDQAPIPLNLLFLGDAHWLAGNRDDAIANWQRATRARADAETREAAPLLREIARLRVLAAEGQ